MNGDWSMCMPICMILITLDLNLNFKFNSMKLNKMNGT